MVGLHAVLRGGAFLMGGTLVQAMVAFAANLVLVRQLDPAQFGRFAVVQASAALILSLLSLRVVTLIMRTPEAELDRKRRQLLFSVISIETGVAALAILAGLAATGTLETMDLALAAAILVGHWASQVRGFYERGLRYGRLAAIETGVQVAAHILAVLLVLAGAGAGALYLRELFLALAGLAGLAAIGGLELYRPRWPAWSEWRMVARAARGIWLDSMLDNSFQRLSLLAVNAGAGLSGAGLFFQAQRLAVVPHQFLMPVVGRVMVGWFGRTENAADRRSLRRRMALLMTPPLALAALLAWAFADPVVPWIFGAAWTPAAPVLASLAGMIVFLSLFELQRSYALTSAQARLLLLSRVGQYMGLGWMCLPLLNGGTLAPTHIGYGLSLAYGLAFAGLVLLLRWRERRTV